LALTTAQFYRHRRCDNHKQKLKSYEPASRNTIILISPLSPEIIEIDYLATSMPIEKADIYEEKLFSFT
jgi:hypothetical protein